MIAILTMAMRVMIGPYITSIKLKIRVFSMIPKSFENLLVSTPEGVSSKKLAGERTTVSIIC